MKFFTALHLSLNNLMTKKGRTILTAFSGSIGIIGIALILSLSNGVQNYINKVQEETLTSYPLTIEEATLDLTSSMIEKYSEDNKEEVIPEGIIRSNNTITDTLELMSSKVKSNNLKQFKEYIESDKSNIKDYTTAIGYTYDLNLQIYKEDTSKEIVQVNPCTVLDNLGMQTSGMQMQMVSTDVGNQMLDNQ